MKIKNLNESIKLTEADEGEINTLEDSTKEATQNVIDGAAEVGVEISAEAAKKEVEAAKKATELIPDPYGSTAKLSEAEEVLQDSLMAVLRKRRVGFESDYPNVILYGLAGFGKTSVVKAFCAAHNIEMLYYDVSNLTQEQFLGIPTADVDKRGKKYLNIVNLPIWNKIKNDETENPSKYYLLVLDEVNHASKKIRDILSDFINGHNLPIASVDPKTGKYKTITHFDNILFTVGCMNPASLKIFSDNEAVPQQIVNRFSQFIEVTGNNADFLNRVVTPFYNKLLSTPNLSQEDINCLEGQRDLLTALMKSKNPRFVWDDQDKAIEANDIVKKTGIMANPLSYRSLMLLVSNCDGTKADFLKKLKRGAFLQATKANIEQILQTYQDKISKSNSVFTQAATPTAAAAQRKAHADVQDALDTFAKELGN